MTTQTTPPAEHILQFFAYQHLPVHLQAVSALFYTLAHQIVERTPRNPERTVALRKLLESKDAAVRAALATDSPADARESALRPVDAGTIADAIGATG